MFGARGRNGTYIYIYISIKIGTKAESSESSGSSESSESSGSGCLEATKRRENKAQSPETLKSSQNQTKTRIKDQKHSKSIKSDNIGQNRSKVNKIRQNQSHPWVKITHINSGQHPRVNITHIHSVQHPLNSQNQHSILQNSNPLNSIH